MCVRCVCWFVRVCVAYTVDSSMISPSPYHEWMCMRVCVSVMCIHSSVHYGNYGHYGRLRILLFRQMYGTELCWWDTVGMRGRSFVFLLVDLNCFVLLFEGIMLWISELQWRISGRQILPFLFVCKKSKNCFFIHIIEIELHIFFSSDN